MEVTAKKDGQSPAHHVPPCKIARGAGQGKKLRRGLIPTGSHRNMMRLTDGQAFLCRDGQDGGSVTDWKLRHKRRAKPGASCADM